MQPKDVIGGLCSKCVAVDQRWACNKAKVQIPCDQPCLKSTEESCELASKKK